MRYFLIILLLLTSILIADITYTEYVTKKDAKSRFVSLGKVFVEHDKLSFSLKKNTKGPTGCITDQGIAEISDTGNRKSVKAFSEKLRTVHVFGDSFTFGFGVDDTETFPAFLENYNSFYNIINYGVPGFGLTQMYVSLLMNLDNIQKGDIVLFTPIFEDFFRDLYSPRNVLWMKTFSRLKFKNFPIYSNGSIKYRNLDELKYFLTSKLYLSSFLGKSTGDSLRDRKMSIRTSKQMLSDIRDQVRRKGGKFILTFLPTLNDDKAANQLVLDNINGRREVLSNYALIDNKKSLFRLECDFHYNERGNMFIAKELTKIIEGVKF